MRLKVWEVLRSILAPTPIVLKFLLIGLAVRFLLAPWTSVPYDAYPFYSAAAGTLAGTGPYGMVLFSYPPLFAVISYPLILLYSQFFDPGNLGVFVPSMVEVSRTTGILVPFVTAPAFNLLLKTPLILGDMLVGLLIFRTVRSWKGEELAVKAFLIWFLNPLVIFVSAVHGQFDVLPAYCALVGMLAFMDRRYLLSGTVLGVGVLLKIFPVYLIVLCLVSLSLILVREARAGKGLVTLRPFALFIAGGGLSLATILPFLLSSSSFLEFVLRRGTYTSLGGLNLWFLSPMIQALGTGDVTGGTVFPLGTMLTVLGLALTVLVSFLLLRRPEGNERENFLLANTFVIVILLLTQPVTNPQHLIWLFPPLLLLSLVKPQMLGKLYILTVVGLLFNISLQSGFAFFYPWAQFVGSPGVTLLNDSIMTYFVSAGFVRYIMLSVLGGVGAVVLASIMLPARLDPVESLLRRWTNWRCHHA